MERGSKIGLEDVEWQRKTCQHIIRMIKDEQVLLDEALHPEVVAATLEVIDMLLKKGNEKGKKTQ